MPIDDLLTTTEAAEHLKVSTRTVQRYVDDGTLRVAHRTPGPKGRYLFYRADVDMLLQQMVPTVRRPRRTKEDVA